LLRLWPSVLFGILQISNVIGKRSAAPFYIRATDEKCSLEFLNVASRCWCREMFCKEQAAIEDRAN